MSVAVSWIHLRSQVRQDKWNGTLHPVPQIPSAAFPAGWVIDRLKDSEAQCFVPFLFGYMWQVGSASIGTKLRLALSLKLQGFLHWSVLLCKGEAVRVATLFRSSHILLDPQWRPPCWQAGHLARIHSTNALLAPFLARLMPGNDRCSVDQAGTVSDCSNGWDFLSDRIYPVVMDGVWKTRGRWERKLAALHHGGSVKCPPTRLIGEAPYLTRVEGIKSNLITGARLAFIFLLLSESPPWRESTNLQGSRWMALLKSSVVCSWLCSIWPFYEPSGIVNRKQKRGNVFLKHCTDD